MEKEFEENGEFFFHDKPNEKFQGRLKYSHLEGTKLQLFSDRIIDRFLKMPSKASDFKLIIGVLNNGKTASLFSNNSAGFSIPFPGKNTYTINSTYAFIGDQEVLKLSDLKFKYAKVHYRNLEEWLKIYEFESTIGNNNSFKIEYKLPEDIAFLTSPNFNIKYFFRANVNTGFKNNELKIIQKAFVEFSLSRKEGFYNFYSRINHFRNFLSVVFQKKVTIDEIQFINKKNNKEYITNFYFKSSLKKDGSDEISSLDLLIPYMDFKTELEKAIILWFKNKFKYESIYNPYLRAFYSSSTYPPDMFLSIARGIEAYHRTVINSNKNYPFVKRIEETIKKFSKCFSSQLKIRSIPKFSENIKNLRNEYTHSSPVTYTKNDKLVKTYYYSKKLELVLLCAILNLNGFDLKDITTILKESRLFHYLSDH